MLLPITPNLTMNKATIGGNTESNVTMIAKRIKPIDKYIQKKCYFMIDQKEELILVYNADSGFYNMIKDKNKYDKFKELAKPKKYEYNLFGEDQSTITFKNNEYTIDPDGSGPASSFSFYNPDFNVKSLRGTIVLRWEYLTGSTLYFVWTQNRADYSNPGDFSFRRDLKDLLTAPGDNIFLVKVSYRWNI